MIDITCLVYCNAGLNDKAESTAEGWSGGALQLMHTGLWRLVNGCGLLLHHGLILTCTEEEICGGDEKIYKHQWKTANAHPEHVLRVKSRNLGVFGSLFEADVSSECCDVAHTHHYYTTRKVQHLHSATVPPYGLWNWPSASTGLCKSVAIIDNHLLWHRLFFFFFLSHDKVFSYPTSYAVLHASA